MESEIMEGDILYAFLDISFQYSIIPIYVCEALWALIKATFFEGGFFTMGYLYTGPAT